MLIVSSLSLLSSKCEIVNLVRTGCEYPTVYVTVCSSVCSSVRWFVATKKNRSNRPKLNPVYMFMLNWFPYGIFSSCFSCFSKKITDKKRYTADSKKTDSNSNKNSGITSASSSSSSSSSTPTQSVPSSSKQRRRISEPKTLLDLCVICQSPLNIAGDQATERAFQSSATCNNCLSQTCKSPRCTVWLPRHDHWQCSNCHHFDCLLYVRAYDWIFECLSERFYDKATAERVTKHPPQPLRPSPSPSSPSTSKASPTGTAISDQSTSTTQDDVMFELNGNFDESEQKETFFINLCCPLFSDKSSPIPLKQRIRVREFIEELLSSMLGGPLDSVYVGQIYKNLECKYNWRTFYYFANDFHFSPMCRFTKSNCCGRLVSGVFFSLQNKPFHFEMMRKEKQKNINSINHSISYPFYFRFKDFFTLPLWTE